MNKPLSSFHEDMWHFWCVFIFPVAGSSPRVREVRGESQVPLCCSFGGTTVIGLALLGLPDLKILQSKQTPIISYHFKGKTCEP